MASFNRQKKDAVSLIKEQLEKEPNNERILTDAVRIYLETGNIKTAMTLLSQFNQLYPSSIEAKKAQGLLKEMEGKPTEAVTIYEQILNSGQKDLSIVKYLGSFYLYDKKWEKAILVFRRGLENFPNEPDLLEQLGRLLVSCPESRLRNIEDGREYSERAFIHYQCPPPTRINAARNLATAYAVLGDKQAASHYIRITLDMVSRGKVPPQDYFSYFQVLKKQFNLPN
jgi:tetratricopeptide (TPR) repeat protein